MSKGCLDLKFRWWIFFLWGRVGNSLCNAFLKVNHKTRIKKKKKKKDSRLHLFIFSPWSPCTILARDFYFNFPPPTPSPVQKLELSPRKINNKGTMVRWETLQLEHLLRSSCHSENFIPGGTKKCEINTATRATQPELSTQAARIDNTPNSYL